MFTEVFLLFFSVGSKAYEFGYYIPMRLFHIGLLPSIILFYFCKLRIEKVLGLTLVISQAFWAIREVLAINDGFDWLVLGVSSLDYCWIFFIVIPITLSLLTDALLNNNHISLLISID
jgi:hypothetical protein